MKLIKIIYENSSVSFLIDEEKIKEETVFEYGKEIIKNFNKPDLMEIIYYFGNKNINITSEIINFVSFIPYSFIDENFIIESHQ